MAGSGRPTVQDKRNHQYRVCLNDEEDQMLHYGSQATGKPKSLIFRKALELDYQTVQMNEIDDLDMAPDHIRLTRVIRCPYCNAGHVIDLSDYMTGELSYEWQMGSEIEYAFHCVDYIEAGNPGIAGKMYILSAEQLQFSDLDKVDFDPPHSWQSMAYDQVITYEMEGNNKLYLFYTDEKTEHTSTLVFNREFEEQG